MIISASRRTDIPAFHSQWFLNRIREGYVVVDHHPGSGRLYRVPLTPDLVDCIVFRSKNPAPMVGKIDALSDYRLCFNITMNCYGHEMEANVPGLQERIETFRKLSAMTGARQMVWRYDPILISPKYDMDYHRRVFGYLCHELQGLAYKAMIGFIIHHPFVARRIDPFGVKRKETADVLAIAELFSGIARKYDTPLETCAEITDLDRFGIRHGACVERDHMEKIVGCIFGKVREKYLRPHCNCMESIDIGYYSTCANGCLYCYATPEAAHMNIDPRSPILAPGFDLSTFPDENIVDVKCQTFKTGQMSLW